MKKGRPLAVHAMLRGLRGQCPRCGKGRLFGHWNALREECEHCGLRMKEREGDCWAFMYASTAFITGIFILVMFAIHPREILLGQIVIGSAGLVTIIGTLPIRKGLALALDFLVDRNPSQATRGSS